jgi:hypothetical protein
MGKKSEIVNLAGVEPGDLVFVKWFDATIGKSRASALSFRVPVVTFGVFLFVSKTDPPSILIAQNSFEYATGFYDVDYTAVPAAWACEVKVLLQHYVERQQAAHWIESFMLTENQVKRSSEPRAFLHRQQHLRAGSHRGRLNV